MGASSPKYRTRVEWRLLDRPAATGGMSVASLLPSASLPTKSLFSLSLAKRYHNCFLFLSVPRFRCTLHQPRCLCKDTASDSALLECSSSCSLEKTRSVILSPAVFFDRHTKFIACRPPDCSGTRWWGLRGGTAARAAARCRWQRCHAALAHQPVHHAQVGHQVGAGCGRRRQWQPW